MSSYAYIKNISISVNGRTVTQADNWGAIEAYLDQMRRGEIELSSDGASYAPYIAVGASQYVAVNGFPDTWLSGEFMRYMPTSMFKDTKITLTLADPVKVAFTSTNGITAGYAVMPTPTPNASTSANYASQWISCDALMFSDSSYTEEILDAIEHDANGLSIPYSNIIIQPSDTVTGGTLTFSKRYTSDSVNKLLAVMKAADGSNPLANSGPGSVGALQTSTYYF